MPAVVQAEAGEGRASGDPYTWTGMVGGAQGHGCSRPVDKG